MNNEKNNLIDLSTDSKYWISRILNDAESHPDIKIVALPNENFGSIHVIMPSSLLDIRKEDDTDGGSGA